MTILDPKLVVQSNIDEDIAIFDRLSAVQTALRVMMRTTGQRLAVVARITPGTWTACAVIDEANFGLKPGDRLELNTTYCKLVDDSSAPLLINNASEDPRFCDYPALYLYKIKSYIAVPLIRVDGTPFGVVCTLDPDPVELSTDYIEIFKLLAQLIAFEMEAEERHVQNEIHLRSLEDFISIAAHDLRQPITALYGNAQLLARSIQRGAPIEKLSTHVDALLAQSRRAVRLSDTLLDIARIESGKLFLDRTQLDLSTLARQALNDARTLSPSHTFDFEGPASMVIQADENRLTQVFRNLLDNAAKYAPPESGPITFSITPPHPAEDASAPPYVTMTLADHGPGVKDSELPRLFERQFRAANAVERSIAGSGLGLYITCQIIEAHHGNIKASHTPNGGLTLTLTLPTR